MDVAEAGVSPTSPQAKKNAFSFSPIKEKKSFEKALVNLGDTEKAQKGQLQRRESETEVEKVRKHHKQREHMLDGMPAKEKNEDDSLLTEIINKKQELDDLIKKWEDSKNQKTVIDLTSSAHYRNDNVEDKEPPCLRLESLEDTRLLEKGQDGNTEERGGIESVVLTEDEKVTREKPVHTVCVSESDSEGSSVEEITASLRPKESDIIEQSSTYRSPPDEEDSCDARGTQCEVVENIQGELLNWSLFSVIVILAFCGNNFKTP